MKQQYVVLMDSDECLFPRARPQIPLGSPCISAYLKTTGNCQYSESSSNLYDHVSNASGLGIRATKKRRREANSHKVALT